MGLSEDEAPEWMQEHLAEDWNVVDVLTPNWGAVQVWRFAATARQLAVGPGGAVWQRLPLLEMRAAADGLGEEWGADLLWRLTVLEAEASRVLNKPKDRRGAKPFHPNHR